MVHARYVVLKFEILEIQSAFQSIQTVFWIWKVKAKDVYWLLLNKTLCEKSLAYENINWKKTFQMVSKTAKENKLWEFYFKIIDRIFVTKKELFRFKIKEDRDCIYYLKSVVQNVKLAVWKWLTVTASSSKIHLGQTKWRSTKARQDLN